MANPGILASQRDFSAGELDTQAKRRDDLPIVKSGARQMRNWRILNSGVMQQRPGRRSLFVQTGRTEEISIPPSLRFYFGFGGDGSLMIRNINGAQIAYQPPNTYAWLTATVDQIVFTVVKVDIATTDVVICFPGSKLKLARWDGNAWTFPAFSFGIDASGAPLAPFFRVAAPGATMLPSAQAAPGASLTLAFSAPVMKTDDSHVGVLFRFAGARMQITAVASSVSATATALDQLPPCQQLTVAAISGYQIGQVVEGSVSSCKGEVVGIDAVNSYVFVQCTNYVSGFVVSDHLIGPTSNQTVSATATVSPKAAVSWDEQIISDARGWPQSCFSDRGRLGFCDLPQLQEAILWSATGSPYDMAVGALPTDAIVELIAGRPRVYHVGAWYDEIVFTDQGIFYIPIGIANPLQPGSVSFLPVNNEAAYPVKPAFTSEGFLYVTAGRNRINAVIGTGAAYSTRPYVTQDVTLYHTHLFAAGPKGIAVATGDGPHPERYVYVINQDGSVVSGRYEAGRDFTVGQVSARWVGWVPVSGHGTPSWVSVLHSDVVYTTSYGVYSLVEVEDDTLYMDAAVAVNNLPVPMKPQTGTQGPLWWNAKGSVVLMDGLKALGEYQIDYLGKIIPNIAGEDLTSATLTAGFSFQPTFEPFVPNAEPGQDLKQRTRRRRVPRMVLTVENSTGFLFQTLYSGPNGALLPAQGSAVASRRVTAYNQDDDASIAPPLREETHTYRPLGHSYDPRIAVVKDTVGPLRLVECTLEAST